MIVPAFTMAEAQAQFEKGRLASLLALTEAAGCRLATQTPFPVTAGHWSAMCTPGRWRFVGAEPIVLDCDFAMLLPGEWPPDSSCRWLLWERHADGWRSSEIMGRDR